MIAAAIAARHAEVARRYSWAARQRRKTGRAEKPDPGRLMTLIRMRELERIFQSRYGRFLPNDDAGREDFEIMAHHIAHLRGAAVERIVAWARAWCPWMPGAEATALAERVAAKPRKWNADSLAWALALKMTERTALRITTIGAIDCGKAKRAEIRKAKDRDRKRARRAATRSGKPRGRPTKNASAAESDSIAADSFSASGASKVPRQEARAAEAAAIENFRRPAEGRSPAGETVRKPLTQRLGAARAKEFQKNGAHF
jgi:hypothetical protein